MRCHQPQKVGRFGIPLKSVRGLMQFGIDQDGKVIEVQSILTKLAAKHCIAWGGVQRELSKVRRRSGMRVCRKLSRVQQVQVPMLLQE